MNKEESATSHPKLEEISSAIGKGRFSLSSNKIKGSTTKEESAEHLKSKRKPERTLKYSLESESENENYN